MLENRIYSQNVFVLHNTLYYSHRNVSLLSISLVNYPTAARSFIFVPFSKLHLALMHHTQSGEFCTTPEKSTLKRCDCSRAVDFGLYNYFALRRCFPVSNFVGKVSFTQFKKVCSPRAESCNFEQNKAGIIFGEGKRCGDFFKFFVKSASAWEGGCYNRQEVLTAGKFPHGTVGNRSIGMIDSKQ